MTDSAVTDGDPRNARMWAEKVGPPSVSPGYIGTPSEIHNAARVILATVDAPALSEELGYRAVLLDNGDPDGDSPQALRDLATRAERMERELAEARAEVEQLADVNETPRRTDNFKEFREKLLAVQEAAESNAETPNPADVPAGEPWLVRDGQELSVAVRDAERWVLTHLKDATIRYRRVQRITLVARLVPAPRVITDPDELDRLPRRAVILSTDGQADVYQKGSNGEWVDGASYGYPSRQVIRMENAVTVLWGAGGMTHYNHQAPPPCGASSMKEEA